MLDGRFWCPWVLWLDTVQWIIWPVTNISQLASQIQIKRKIHNPMATVKRSSTLFVILTDVTVNVGEIYEKIRCVGFPALDRLLIFWTTSVKSAPLQSLRLRRVFPGGDLMGHSGSGSGAPYGLTTKTIILPPSQRALSSTMTCFHLQEREAF